MCLVLNKMFWVITRIIYTHMYCDKIKHVFLTVDLNQKYFKATDVKERDRFVRSIKVLQEVKVKIELDVQEIYSWKLQ